MSNFVITGATGYIGSRLVHYLLNLGHSVFAIKRESSSLQYLDDVLEQQRLRLYNYNATHTSIDKAFKGNDIEAVFHLASSIGSHHTPQDIQNYVDSNIAFPTQLLEAMCHNNCNLMVNTGTFWQYFSKNLPYPTCLYAATKQCFEEMINFYCFDKKLRAITLNLFDVYGPGDNRPKLFNVLSRAHDAGLQSLDMSPGDQKLSMTYIDDVLEAFYIAYKHLRNSPLDASHMHQKYFVASELNTLKEVVHLYLKINQSQLKINWGKLAYRPNQIMEPFVSDLLPDWEAKVSLLEGLTRIKEAGAGNRP